MTTPRHPEALPAASAAALRRLTESELSLPARLGFVTLLLVSLTMTGVLVSLWATEPELPLRTRWAFGLMAAIGACWAVFAVWVLRQRRVLLARHRIIAGRMAVTFTTTFVLAALLLGFTTAMPGAYKAAAVGLILLGAALFALVHAQRSFARLSERRELLARELEGRAR